MADGASAATSEIAAASIAIGGFTRMFNPPLSIPSCITRHSGHSMTYGLNQNK